ncbi:MAG: helix-turn-helix domain-containing protein [archaeon]
MALDFAKTLGLTDYELKAYLALVKGDQLKGSEVAKNAAIPNAKVYGTLRSLIKKNLAVLVREKPFVFKGVEPEKAIEALMDERSSELKNAALNALGFFKSQPLKRQSEELLGKIELNVGREQRFRTAQHLHDSARKYFYMVSPVNFVLPAYLLKARANAVKKGVDEKFIVSKLTGENRNEVKKYASVMEIRFLEDPDYENLSIYVWDDKKFLIVVIDPVNKAKSITVTIDSSDLAKAMKKYFLELYRKAKPVQF